MGIDVWERKVLHAIEPVTEVSQTSMASDKSVKQTKSVPEVEPTAAPATSPKREPAPRFRLAMFHYESVGVCLMLNERADVPRRLCDDIAKVAGGNVSALRFQELKWPMLETAGIDQSVEAAREVVTQKFHALPNHVVVVGNELATYFQPLSSGQHLQPLSVGRQKLLMINDLASFQTSADDKRQLMRLLHEWRTPA